SLRRLPLLEAFDELERVPIDHLLPARLGYRYVERMLPGVKFEPCVAYLWAVDGRQQVARLDILSDVCRDGANDTSGPRRDVGELCLVRGDPPRGGQYVVRSPRGDQGGPQADGLLLICAQANGVALFPASDC